MEFFVLVYLEVLGTVGVQLVQQECNVQLADVHGRLIGDVLAFGIGHHFVQKVDFLQFIKSLVGQAYGYLALLGYVFGSIGRFVFSKRLATNDMMRMEMKSR